MTADQIRSLGPALSEYLDEFADCFGSGDTRLHLKDYVKGQLSDLPRKSVEPMAHLADVPPRTLQEFLSLSDWDHELLRTRLQQIVARDHADPHGIGIVDESGHPKKGGKTACVQRQYCGTTGKIDNCVMTVHLAYSSWDNASFRTMLDSDLFLPEGWDNDPERRREAEVPDDVHYRPKYDIALEQLRRARANDVRFAWVTADEWYGGKGPFVTALEQMGQSFVVEVPRNLLGWLHAPPTAGPQGGVTRRDKRPRDGGGSTIENLCAHSSAMTGRAWKRFHVKDTHKGPMVWEARAAPWWTERDGHVAGPYRLVVARDVLDRDEVKYFLSDRTDVPLRVTLHVAFSRWPVERCLEDEKTELGLSHFECRKYAAVLRHLLLTQVSHLFLARQCLRLRGEKRRGRAAAARARRDDLPGPDRGRSLARCAAPVVAWRPRSTHRAGGGADPLHADVQRGGRTVPHQGPPPPAAGDRNPRRATHLLPPAVTATR
jgi:SRSO17 transposase